MYEDCRMFGRKETDASEGQAAEKDNETMAEESSGLTSQRAPSLPIPTPTRKSGISVLFNPPPGTESSVASRAADEALLLHHDRGALLMQSIEDLKQEVKETTSYYRRQIDQQQRRILDLETEIAALKGQICILEQRPIS